VAAALMSSIDSTLNCASALLTLYTLTLRCARASRG
jgi:hypothetical protein